jgi:ketosteroid isomerase-like protein
MSHEDRETLRLVYEAYNRGDSAGALCGMHPDIEWKTIRSGGPYRGHEEVRRFLEDMREPFEEVVAKPEQWFEHGDRIVVFVRIRARPRGSDAVAENRVGYLWTMRGGKALRCETFPKREDALEAAGLSE